MLQIVLRSDEIFICVQNCPQFPEQRSTSLQQPLTALQGRDGILEDMYGMFDNVQNAMESLYSSIPQLQPTLTKHPRFLECELCSEALL